MTDEELADYLRDNGYAEYLAREGGAGLIGRWKKFVDEVERGYPYSLEEYRTDLDLRGLIAMAGLDEQVREEDRRFALRLTHRDCRVWESGITTDPFWDYGYPGNAGRRLLKDLQEEGLA